MRTAGSDTQFVYHPETLEVIGFILAGNFCAEHEWGIKPLQAELIPEGAEKRYGIERRRVSGERFKELIGLEQFKQVVHSNRFDAKKEVKLTLKCARFFKKTEYDKPRKFNYIYNSQAISGEWCDSCFSVVGFGVGALRFLTEIHAAGCRGDLLMMIGNPYPRNPFSPSGLTLGIISRLPEEVREAMEFGDRDREKLLEASKETGIEEKLKKFGKNWFALSPRWIKDFEGKQSKYSVIYWLNPYDQQKNNSGWFTVEDLELWAENTGPVIKEIK